MKLLKVNGNIYLIVKSGDDDIRKKVILFALFLLWILVIFYNSSQTAINSNEISFKIVRYIAKGYEKLGFEPITTAQFMKINVIVRKLAHGFQFCILAIILNTFITYLNVKRENIIFYTLLLVIAFAIGDELHQLFVDGRTPSAIDVVIDFIGGVVGVILINVLHKGISRRVLSRRY